MRKGADDPGRAEKARLVATSLKAGTDTGFTAAAWNRRSPDPAGHANRPAFARPSADWRVAVSYQPARRVTRAGFPRGLGSDSMVSAAIRGWEASDGDGATDHTDGVFGCGASRLGEQVPGWRAGSSSPGIGVGSGGPSTQASSGVERHGPTSAARLGASLYPDSGRTREFLLPKATSRIPPGG